MITQTVLQQFTDTIKKHRFKQATPIYIGGVWLKFEHNKIYRLCPPGHKYVEVSREWLKKKLPDYYEFIEMGIMGK